MTDMVNEPIGFRITSSDSLGHFYPKWFTLHSVLGFPGNWTQDLDVACIFLCYLCYRNDFMAQAIQDTTLKVIFTILKQIHRSRRIRFDVICVIWYDSDFWAYLYACCLDPDFGFPAEAQWSRRDILISRHCQAQPEFKKPAWSGLDCALNGLPQSGNSKTSFIYIFLSNQKWQMEASWCQRVWGNNPAGLDVCWHYNGRIVKGFTKEWETKSCQLTTLTSLG